MSAFDRTLMQDRASDERLVEELERLRLAAESPSIETLKTAALAAATAMASVISERNETHRRHTESLSEQVKKLGVQLADAKQESELDPLTRLANRRAIDVAIERAAVLRSLSEQRACLLLIDIDHFKHVNDTHGHPAGDEVLKRLANGLVRVFPRRTDLVGRYGGEEFCVLLGDAHASDLPKLSERLLVVHRRGASRLTRSPSRSPSRSGTPSWPPAKLRATGSAGPIGRCTEPRLAGAIAPWLRSRRPKPLYFHRPSAMLAQAMPFADTTATLLVRIRACFGPFHAPVAARSTPPRRSRRPGRSGATQRSAPR